MTYNSYEELYKLIQEINNKFYFKILENCFFLEEAKNKNYVIFMKEIRDSYSHLARVFKNDNPLGSSSKNTILKELDKFSGHLERLAIESIKLVLNYYIEIITLYYKNKNLKDALDLLNLNIARKIKELRLNINSISFEDRYNGYTEIVKYLDDYIEKNKIS